MKRSEAIKLIVDTIEANSNDNLEEWACYILEVLEDAGMAPPEYNQNEGSGKFGISSYYVREWQDE